MIRKAHLVAGAPFYELRITNSVLASPSGSFPYTLPVRDKTQRSSTEVILHPSDAAQLARDLIQRHGLTGWSFRFDHARRRFGACRFHDKRITLSRPLTLLNSEQQVRDTILHEIAHALAPGDGHGPRWKAACRAIGAQPRRCYTDDDVKSPPRGPAPYQTGCPRCDWWIDRRRLTASRYLCRICRDPVIYRHKATGRHFLVHARQHR